MHPTISSLQAFLDKSASRKSAKRQLLVIVGAGVEHGHEPDVSSFLIAPEHHRREFANTVPAGYLAFPPSAEHDADAHVWDMYECARIVSALAPPPILIYLLRELALLGRIRSIVSLNYTSYLEHVLECDSLLYPLRNPILRGSSFDPEGYYTNPSLALGDEFGQSRAIPLFMPHGSLHFASYSSCPPLVVKTSRKNQKSLRSMSHVFRLPRFPISCRNLIPTAYISQTMDKKGLKRQYHLPLRVFDRTGGPIGADELHETFGLTHHIDWNDPSGSRRDRFRSEIDASLAEIEKAAKNRDCGILLLGFTARFEVRTRRGDAWVEYNEEIAKKLLALRRSTPVAERMWSILSSAQSSRLSKKQVKGRSLIRSLRRKERLLEPEFDNAMGWTAVAEQLASAARTKERVSERYDSWNQTWCRVRQGR